MQSPKNNTISLPLEADLRKPFCCLSNIEEGLFQQETYNILSKYSLLDCGRQQRHNPDKKDLKSVLREDKALIFICITEKGLIEESFDK